MRSQRFCLPLLDKNRNYEGIWSNKRKSFVKSVGVNGSNFKNETLFVSFTAIITTRNGWNGTNVYTGNRVVTSIKMSRNRLVNMIVPYGTKVFSKSIYLAWFLIIFTINLYTFSCFVQNSCWSKACAEAFSRRSWHAYLCNCRLCKVVWLKNIFSQVNFISK